MEKEVHILTPAEREELLAEKKSLERGLREQEQEKWGRGGPGEQLNKSGIKKQIEYFSRILDKQREVVSSVDKDRIAKEARRLEEEIQRGMLSRERMYHPREGDIMEHVMWERRNREKIMRWKQLQRRLEPDNPTISNIERLRRQK